MMVRIGVIGCGYWGPNLVRNFLEVEDAEVIICCDHKPERLKYIRQRFPFLRVTLSADELLSDPEVDAVCVATPVSTHYELSRKALEAGKHLLVEKPMVASSQQGEELIRLAEEKGLTLMVGHVFEYTPAVNYIKQLVEKGELGQIYYADSNRVNLGRFQEDVNVVWDLASHDLSILMYIFGREPEMVSAVGGSFVTKGVEDVAFINLRFSHNTIAHVHVSWMAPVKFRRMVFGGSKKMVVYDDMEVSEKVKVFDKGVDVVVQSSPSGLFERQLIYRTGDVISPVLDSTETLKIECQHFIDCIRTGRRPRSDGASGLRVVRVLEAIDESLRRGEPVRLG